MKVVYVEWLDASYQEGPLAEDELIPHVILFSAGVLIREDDKTVSLATDYCSPNGDWRHVSHIPKVNIIRRKFFNVPGKSRKSSAK